MDEPVGSSDVPPETTSGVEDVSSERALDREEDAVM